MGGAPAIGHTIRRGGGAPVTAPPSLLAVTELLWGGGVCGRPAGRVAGGPGPVKRCLWGGARVWTCVRQGLTTSSLEWLSGGGVDRTLIGWRRRTASQCGRWAPASPPPLPTAASAGVVRRARHAHARPAVPAGCGGTPRLARGGVPAVPHCATGWPWCAQPPPGHRPCVRRVGRVPGWWHLPKCGLHCALVAPEFLTPLTAVRRCYPTLPPTSSRCRLQEPAGFGHIRIVPFVLSAWLLVWWSSSSACWAVVE